MRLLFIGKRRPQQRDLATRPYGRFVHLPRHLAARGHAVTTILCSHDGGDDFEQVSEGVAQHGVDVRRARPRELLASLDRIAAVFRPDWVIALSDAWYGPLAKRLASRTSARLAIDAYDNYEAYMPWNLPLHWAWRRAVRAAELVTAAGPQLAELLERSRRRRDVHVLPMAADDNFVPRDKEASRRALGLPSSPLVAYAGSWTNRRGSDLILDAMDALRERRPDARLIVTGRPPARVTARPDVIATGYVDDEVLPDVLSAADVACVVTANTAFGRYSYPAKLCEAMACGVPVAATATDAVRWMLGGAERHLAPVGDARALAGRIAELLASPATEYPPRSTWSDVAARFDALLGDATGGPVGQ